MFLWREESAGLTSSSTLFLRLLWRFKHLWQEGAYSKGGLLTNKMLYSNYKRSFYFPKWVVVLGLFFKVTEHICFMTWVCTGCMCLHVSGLEKFVLLQMNKQCLSDWKHQTFIFELTFSTRAAVLQVVKNERGDRFRALGSLGWCVRKRGKTEEPTGKSILWPEIDTPPLSPPID